ncbi:GntR family transcriptional regulator [Yinghuangia sp. ASG 101]|uniref:GntR family transcriptional regulator n=1 Tax=Yinghuangia sp. ASG 101 TaxID=2896848 RepID=UPI001E44919D|nr:GntR family transcriptional regulator [Yinghuangia sp. ASG 101]UGQ11443.1 GntR family transcriptional regulator [Yinghuangia sp. ASG 101]
MRAIPRPKQQLESPLPSYDRPSTVLPGEQLQRPSSGEQVRLYVRRLIFDAVLKQGQRVPQDAIAQALGVSRVPVREALLTLEREGWVTIVPHRGVFVNRLDEQTVWDHYELYGLFYGFGVRRAVEREGQQLAVRVEPIEKKIAKAKGPERLYEFTMAFHRAIIDAAHSPRLRAILRQMTDLVPGNFFELVPGTDVVTKEGTAAIVAAIRNNDADEANRAYATMLRRQGEQVVQLFRSRGIFDGETEDADGLPG